MSLGRLRSLARGEAQVTIVDQNGIPVSRAKVQGRWSGLVSGTASRNTNGSGIATFTSSWTSKRGTFTFTVENVTATGYTYDPSANVETRDSISW